MQLLICGDQHLKGELGHSAIVKDNRINEKKEVLNFIVKQAEDCDGVVLMGDVFHKKNPQSSVIKEFINFINKLSDKQIYIIDGNHNKFVDGRSTLDFLRELNNPNWHIFINKIEQIENLCFCPYFFKNELGAENNNRGLRILHKKLAKHHGILFAHMSISGTFLSSTFCTDDMSEMVLDKDKLKHFDYIVGGHIHTPSKNNNILITGSIYNNEVNETGKMIYKLDTKTLEIEKIKLPGRKIYKIVNPDIDKIKLEKYAIYKIVITDKGLRSKIPEIKEYFKEADGLIVVEKYINEREALDLDEGLLEFDVESLLKVYAKSKKIDYLKLKNPWEKIKE